MKLSENLDSKIDQLVTEAFSELHPSKNFVAGETNIPVTGKVSAGLQYDYYLRNAEYYLVRGYETTQKSHQEIKLVVGYAL
jgi:hypothetical protein